MAHTRLILRKTGVDRPVIVYVLWSGPTGKTKINTGEKLHPQHWDAERCRVRRSHPDHQQLNDLLTARLERVNAITRRLKLELDADPTPEQVNAALEQRRPQPNKKSGKSVVPVLPVQQSVHHFYDEWIVSRRATHRPATLTVYRVVQGHLRDFEARTHQRLTLVDFTLTFYEQFNTYLLQARQLTSNTQSKVIKTIKTFLGWATAKGYATSSDFKRFRRLHEAVAIVALTPAELSALEAWNGPQRLARVRDIFLLGCYSGLRFSDLMNLGPESRVGDKLRVHTMKTRTLLSIPLSQQAAAIWQRYQGRLPRISNQKLNAYIKELCQSAGLATEVRITKMRGGVREEAVYPKWQLISCHTARRTFVTLSLQRGVRPEVLMPVTGHTSLRTFQRYIRIEDEVVQAEMAEAWN
jgi:integrase